MRDIERLDVEGGHEIVLVNDGSADRTIEPSAASWRARLASAAHVIEHARNFGEHNAVLTGWRHARGAHIVNLDDDGQNPPREAVRLWQHAKATGADVVFGHYETKQHSPWRNFGSWFTNRITDWALDKPHGFYLSSFRCVSAFAAREVVVYAGPYPYIDGLLLQVTQRIESLIVAHEPRRQGQSGYTLRRLLRLWLSAWLNFSLLPLRLATPAGSDHRRPRTGGVLRGVVALVRESRARLRVRLADGGVADLFGHAARDARADWRVSRPDVPDRQPAAAGRRAGGDHGRRQTMSRR